MDALQAMLTNIKTTEPSAVGSPLAMVRVISVVPSRY